MANCWTKVAPDVSEVSKQANYTLSCKLWLDQAINNIVSWRDVINALMGLVNGVDGLNASIELWT